MQPTPAASRRLLRVLFWTAAVVAFAAAVSPPGTTPEFVPWDKAQHFIAFYVLAILGAAAYSRSSPLKIGASLSAFGALIELVQAIPAVHRDADFWDWAADTVAVTAALAPLVLVRMRAWLAG